MWQPNELLRRARSRIAGFGKEVTSGTTLGTSIDIRRLICPLRYDIWVRIEFIRLLRDEWSLYNDHLAAFRELPPARTYYRWFKDIRCARYEPRILGDPAKLDAAFLERVHRTAELWQSVERNGFDSSSPIRLMSGRSIHSVNGKTINAKYFAGDGCHRIACLHLLGQTILSPVHYEVVVKPSLEPIDNTATLIDSLPLRPALYLRYLSHFYCDDLAVDSAEAMLRYVADVKPDLLPELQSVLAVDLPRISAHG